MQQELAAIHEEMRSLVDSTPLLGSREALRERAAAEGYLFFKQLLPKQDLLPVRRDLLEVVDRHGWKQQNRKPHDGTIDLDALNQVPDEQMRPDIGVSRRAYEDVQKIESVHRLPHHPRLLALYRTLFGGEVLVHPRHIIRMITAHRCMVPTPQHQDFPLVQGTTETWTAWVPLGDCPREMGGLAVLKGSHKFGYFPVATARGAGNIAAQLCPGEGGEWATIPYEAGDVLTFPSLTVHRGTRCQWRDQIRLSMDVRYQAAGDVVEEKSLKPHCELDWEAVYAGWQRNDLKYYWRRSQLQIAPWNDGLVQPQRRIC